MTQNLPAIQDFSKDKIELIKNTVCKGLSIENFEVFLHIAKRTGLDPLAKQIYAIIRKGQMTIQTGIDGFRLIAERTGKYCPGKEPSYQYKSDGSILAATSYVKKLMDDGSWHEIAATAFWDEYHVPNNNPSYKNFWERMPHLMLAKCAEALCLRKCFPADLSALYTDDEMGQAACSEIILEAKPDPSSNQDNSVISKEQHAEIEGFFEFCDPIFVSKVYEWIDSKGIKELRFLPSYEFKRLKERLQNHIIERQKAQGSDV